jgi:aspartyl-tRNA(Asn)/glutamyl-tRNA(Gln) amidotransferase subunit C
LSELSTEGIEPLSHVFPVNNAFRDDEVNVHDGSEITLANAPKRKEDYFAVPKTV